MIVNKIMLRYIFSIVCFLLFSMPFYGQENAQNTEQKKKSYFDGVRFSYDISNFLETALKPFKKEEEFQLDAYISEKYLLSGGFGFTEINRDENNFLYKQQGFFLKAGVDYNTFDDRKNILTVGGRLGTSFYEHEANNVGIIAYDSIWPNYTNGFVQPENFFATWVELAFNMKVEVIKHIYLGWSVQGKLLLFNSHGREMEPYEIPGFGRGDKNAVFGFNYFVSLHVPLTKSNLK